MPADNQRKLNPMCLGKKGGRGALDDSKAVRQNFSWEAGRVVRLARTVIYRSITSHHLISQSDSIPFQIE